MKRKTIQIEEELHLKLQEASRKFNMTMAEYTSYCLSYFVNENSDPRKTTGIRELRDVFITFIRSQEKNYLIPQKEFTLRLEKEIDEIGFNIKAVKTKLNEKLP